MKKTHTDEEKNSFFLSFGLKLLIKVKNFLPLTSSSSMIIRAYIILGFLYSIMPGEKITG